MYNLFGEIQYLRKTTSRSTQNIFTLERLTLIRRALNARKLFQNQIGIDTNLYKQDMRMTIRSMLLSEFSRTAVKEQEMIQNPKRGTVTPDSHGQQNIEYMQFNDNSPLMY